VARLAVASGALQRHLLPGTPAAQPVQLTDESSSEASDGAVQRILDFTGMDSFRPRAVDWDRFIGSDLDIKLPWDDY
jgi:hypothetical protein